MLLSKDKIHIMLEGQEHNYDPAIHILACFVIEDIVVQNGIYSDEFFNLFNHFFNYLSNLSKYRP